MTGYQIRLLIASSIGAVGGVMAQCFGGWTTDLATLLIFMGVDFITGLMVGVLHKSQKTESGALSSKVGLKGLFKKCGMMLCVLVAYRLDVSLGINFVRTATIIGFIVNESISIIENAKLMGIEIPYISKAVELLKDKGEKK